MRLPRIVESYALVIEPLTTRSAEENNNYRRKQKSLERRIVCVVLMLIPPADEQSGTGSIFPIVDGSETIR